MGCILLHRSKAANEDPIALPPCDTGPASSCSAVPYLGVKLVIAEVERRVDWLEGLEVPAHLLFLPLLGDDGAAVQNQTVRGHSRVQPDFLFVWGLRLKKNNKNTNLFRQRSRYFDSSTPRFHFQQKPNSKKRDGTTETAVAVALLMIDDGEPLLY